MSTTDVTARNIAIINKCYASFVAGEIEPVLAELADDVIFNEVSTGITDCEELPEMWKLLKGKGEVVKFFAGLDKYQKKIIMDVTNIIGSGKDFICVVHDKMTWLPTGKTGEMTSFHKWEFNDEGKVAKFQSFPDSLRYVEMAKP